MFSPSAFRVEMARRRMNMVELAAISGVSYGTITRIMADQIDPRAGTLDKLARAIGVSTAIFFEPDSQDDVNRTRLA